MHSKQLTRDDALAGERSCLDGEADDGDGGVGDERRLVLEGEVGTCNFRPAGAMVV